MEDNLSWKTYEYKHAPKTADWFWMLGIVGVAIAIAAVIFGDVLFAVVILLSTFGIALFAVRAPSLMHIEISDKGVLVDRHFFPYSNLESFCIEEDTHETKLLLKSKRMLMPLIVVPLVDHSGEAAKTFILKHLKEERMEESIWQKIMDRMGV